MTTAHYYLENESGSRINLTAGESEYFLKNIEGLGFKNKNSFESLRNTFFVKTNTDYSQMGIVGDVFFTANAFENYQTLSDFLISADELKFVYKPLDTEFVCDVYLDSLEKTQRESNGTMTSQLSLDAVSLWYTTESISGTSFDVTGSGHYPTAFDITLSGSVTGKPSITIGDETISLNSNVTAPYELRLSTRPSNSVFCLTQAIGTDSESFTEYAASILDNKELSPFILIPIGKTVTISTSTGDIVGTAYHYWRSV